MNHLSKGQLVQLITQIEPQDRLMVKVAYNHALRASEVTGLTGANIRDGFVRIQRLKGSDKTTQPFKHSDEPMLNEFDELVALSKVCGSKEKLFPGWTRFNFHYLIKTAGRRAGLPEHLCHPHALKHTAAMQSIKGGIENTRKFLGHKSLSSTGEYLKVSDEVAWEAVNQYL
jgi:integrase